MRRRPVSKNKRVPRKKRTVRKARKYGGSAHGVISAGYLFATLLASAFLGDNIFKDIKHPAQIKCPVCGKEKCKEHVPISPAAQRAPLMLNEKN